MQLTKATKTEPSAVSCYRSCNGWTEIHWHIDGLQFKVCHTIEIEI